MIKGSVNSDLEATVPLVLMGGDANRRRVDAVIDTGFTGYLTLPSSIVEELDLKWLGREQGILADGSTESFDVYCVTVDWNGRPRDLEVQAVSAEPPIGMALLEHHLLQIEVASSGTVSISPLP